MTAALPPRRNQEAHTQPFARKRKYERVVDGMPPPRGPSRAQRHSLPQVEFAPLKNRAVDTEVRPPCKGLEGALGSPDKNLQTTNPPTKLRLPSSITAPLRCAENALNTDTLSLSISFNPERKPTVPGQLGPSPTKPRRLPISVSRGALDKLV